MIANNFPYAINNKGCWENRQDNSKYYDDDKNMFWLVCMFILVRIEEEEKYKERKGNHLIDYNYGFEIQWCWNGYDDMVWEEWSRFVI